VTRTNALLLGRADGTFAPLTTGRIVTDPCTFANESISADFDNDGDPDFLLANMVPTVGCFYYRNDGRDGFTRMTNSLLERREYTAARYNVGDLNNDGFLDVTATLYDPTHSPHLSQHTFLNDGTSVSSRGDSRLEQHRCRGWVHRTTATTTGMDILLSNCCIALAR
jgi:hypothetical protein